MSFGKHEDNIDRNCRTRPHLVSCCFVSPANRPGVCSELRAPLTELRARRTRVKRGRRGPPGGRAARAVSRGGELRATSAQFVIGRCWKRRSRWPTTPSSPACRPIGCPTPCRQRIEGRQCESPSSWRSRRSRSPAATPIKGSIHPHGQPPGQPLGSSPAPTFPTSILGIPSATPRQAARTSAAENPDDEALQLCPRP